MYAWIHGELTHGCSMPLVHASLLLLASKFLRNLLSYIDLRGSSSHSVSGKFVDTFLPSCGTGNRAPPSKFPHKEGAASRKQERLQLHAHRP